MNTRNLFLTELVAGVFIELRSSAVPASLVLIV